MDSVRSPIALAPWFPYAVAVAVLIIAVGQTLAATRRTRREASRRQRRVTR